MKTILMTLVILTLWLSCVGKSYQTEQTNNGIKTAALGANQKAIHDSLTPFCIEDSARWIPISLPFSLGQYLENYNDYIAFLPSEFLVDYLKTIDREGDEYRCHPFPFSNETISSLLVWVARGDSEYYIVVTLNLAKEQVVDALLIGEVADGNVISFDISEDCIIKSFKSKNVYDENTHKYDLIHEELLSRHMILDNGEFSESNSISKVTDIVVRSIAAMTKESEPAFTIIDVYWINKNGDEIRDLYTEIEVTLYVKIKENEAIGQTIPLTFEHESKDGVMTFEGSGKVDSDHIITIENFKLKLIKQEEQ